MKVLAIVVGLFLVVAALWWWSEWSPTETREELAIETTRDARSETGRESFEHRAEASATEPTRHEVATATEDAPSGAEPEPAYAGPTSRVFGRVVDDAGTPLGGVDISLNTVGEIWIAGVEQEEYETQTDVDGRFELVVPLPTSSWILLLVEPSRFHALADRHFGRAGGRDQDPLVEGDNDLGTFTLASTGVIAGRIRGANGVVPGRARAGLDDSYPGGRVTSGEVDEDGRYAIEHVPPGTYGVEAFGDGCLVSRLANIEVRALVVSEGNDLVLEPAPTLSGRVLDEDGAPIEGARVGGWPVGGGTGAGSKTDADGRFTIHLPQDEPYSLGAKKSGYARFGRRNQGDELIAEPGTTDVEIVLRRAVRTTFVVVSAATGEPVDRLGLSIVEKTPENCSLPTESEELRLRDVPGGEVTLFADPALHEYCIQAPGYAPQRARVAHESPESARHTIRLEAEGRLRGRVLLDGEPIAKATVRLERCRVPLPGVDPTEERPFWQRGYVWDLDGFTGRRRMCTTDAQGRFEIAELATGTYRVEVTATVGAPLVREELHVTGGDVLVELDVQSGELTVELPAGFVLPQHGTLRLFLVCEGKERTGRDFRFHTESMEEDRPVPDDRRWTGGSQDLGALAPGRYRFLVRIHTFEETAPGEFLPTDAAGTELRGEVEVRSGERAVCTLRQK